MGCVGLGGGGGGGGPGRRAAGGGGRGGGGGGPGGRGGRAGGGRGRGPRCRSRRSWQRRWKKPALAVSGGILKRRGNGWHCAEKTGVDNLMGVAILVKDRGVAQLG